MRQQILFIDRDGTLVEEPSEDKQLDSLNKLAFEPQVIPALLKLQEAGYRLVMITNQDGLGTSAFPQQDFDAPHQLMMQIFNSQGVNFEQVLICPHFEADNCSCRKPKLGLIRDYLVSGRLDFSRSAVIGDRQTDMQLASSIGVKGFHYHRSNLDWQSICDKLLGRQRQAELRRTTKETDIFIKLDLDTPEKHNINTGIGFFDHMLEQVATHGHFSLEVNVEGDLYIDDHHSIEDTGLALGEALKQALGNKLGITRFGFCLPMDEAKGECLIDISGRPFYKVDAQFNREIIGGMATEMIPHFFRSFADGLRATVHLRCAGNNEHHKIEAMFKALGRALRQAITIESNNLPSSKGIL